MNRTAFVATIAVAAASCRLPEVGMDTSARAAEAAPEAVDVEPVWAGHPVGFSLLTDGDRQFIAYYDAERRMTVASREIKSAKWTFKKLPSRLGWDSHNYITMALDEEGHLHVSGNMHCVPLVHFRSTKPRDVETLEQVGTMVDAKLERRVTYPKFMKGPEGELIFRYRDGSSGRGNDIYNVYDPATKRWRALLDHPLLDGRGKMNGYFSMPELGPDGRFHIVGVWRDTPDAATNHHLSYARSRDLVTWEAASGKALKTPLTVDNIDVVDPVPPRQGLLNGSFRLAFDSKTRPVISYHRYDDDGVSQIWCARFEGGEWRVRQVSEWKDYRWDFGGGGSLPPGGGVRAGAPEVMGDGRLALSYVRDRERGRWALDEETLSIVGPAPAGTRPGPRTAPSYHRMESDFPGMSKRRAGDLGSSGVPGVRYELVWESLGANRDRPRKPPLPGPSMLRVYRLASEEGP